MASRSPGRRRIVIRSTAGLVLDVRGGKSDTSELSIVRIAISASVDSDTRSFAATSANERFSCGVGRAVIDGAVDFGVPSFTEGQPLSLLQIADTSLSRHHSNTDPTTLLDLNSRLVASTSSLRRYHYLLGVGPLDLRKRALTRAVEGRAWLAFTNGRRDRTESCDGLVDVVEFLISAAIASADTKRRQPMTTLGRLPALNIA
jgi:hypothetical protein